MSRLEADDFRIQQEPDGSVGFLLWGSRGSQAIQFSAVRWARSVADMPPMVPAPVEVRTPTQIKVAEGRVAVEALLIDRADAQRAGRGSRAGALVATKLQEVGFWLREGADAEAAK